jgi:AcrR family transcriptional regulator
MRDGTGTREKLRAMALRLFVEHGVDAVAVRDITTAAGVRPGTLYVHWPSKDALIEELFRSGFEAYSARIVTVLEGEGAFAERLGRLVHEICDIHDEDETLFAFLLLTQHRNLSSVPAGETNPISLIYRAIEAGVRAGEVPAADPLLLTSAVLGTIVQAATFRLYGHTTAGLRDMADEIATLCIQALGLRKDITP